MTGIIPLRVPLDASGLPRKELAAPPPKPERTRRASQPPCTPLHHQGDNGMTLGTTISVTADEQREIFARLQPYLPQNLRRVEPRSGWGVRCEFAAYIGREQRPAIPKSFYDDPKLRYVAQAADPTEHRLRVVANSILTEVYELAVAEWRDAAYVADLRAVISQGVPERWEAYERKLAALESAYDYLRTPNAAKEWPSAVSRLVDAQERTMSAARAFDECACEIAQTHSRHLYADLSRNAALAKAGYPEASKWHIADADHYDSGPHFSDLFSDLNVPLAESVRRLIERQDAHLTKVGRLSGTTA
ncbi:hypothetical protein QR97_39715 [Streptomyces sp. PBH53]|uniref:hypothetical protein n=1 Tax=Streptomyces sp. PBH53 TaxID=1577075 RepID=UPI0006553EDE|nr:hypothetical protein [Streptomyces sp. PBH53]AKN75008.1 hypothetical protein QR97_39715 [Streptomyces sp. PBH53]